MNNLPRVVREAERPGLEPATYWLQVRRRNHYTTTPIPIDNRTTLTAELT